MLETRDAYKRNTHETYNWLPSCRNVSYVHSSATSAGARMLIASASFCGRNTCIMHVQRDPAHLFQEQAVEEMRIPCPDHLFCAGDSESLTFSNRLLSPGSGRTFGELVEGVQEELERAPPHVSLSSKHVQDDYPEM